MTWANQEIDKAEPWKLAKSQDKNDKEKLEELLSEIAGILCDLAKTIKPIMPETSEKITTALVSDKIKKGEPLFPRIN